jgi:hypothetical protein
MFIDTISFCQTKWLKVEPKWKIGNGKFLTVKDEINYFVNAMRNNKLDLSSFHHENQKNISNLP